MKLIKVDLKFFFKNKFDDVNKLPMTLKRKNL